MCQRCMCRATLCCCSLAPLPPPPQTALAAQVCWFHVHYDEAFSSQREHNYKSLTRMHVRPDGALEVFSLALDEVPTK